jgi:chromosome segregation ATPase
MTHVLFPKEFFRTSFLSPIFLEPYSRNPKMRIRKLAFSAAFITVLSTSTSLISPALAQKGSFLEPSTAWAVTKVGKSQGQGSEYCALARRFEEKTIMTVAKNANSETSFALDFQSSVFAMGQDSEVILDPGAGQQRSYTVQPVSDKAFVIRLGSDDAFFQALSRTGFLRVELANRQYTFNLQDIDLGKSQLEACIAAAVMPAAGNIFYDVDAPKEMPNIPVIDSNQDEIATLREEIQRLQEKQTEISNLVTVSGAEVQQQIGAEAQSEMQVLKDQVAKLQSDKDQLMLELAAAAERKDAAIKDSASVETLTRLEKENDQLRKMAREFEVRLSEHSALVAEIDGLRKSNQDLKAAVEQSRSLSEDEKADAELLKETLATLEIQNAELNAQLETAKAGLMNFAAQVSEIEETKKKNTELNQKLAEASERQKEFESVKGSLAKLELEKVRLENAAKEIEQKTAMDLQLKKELESSIKLLETENNRLQSELKKVASSGEQVDILTSQIQLLEQENESLNSRLKDADGRYQGSLAKKDLIVSELEGKIAALNAEKSLQDQQLIELSALSLELDTLKQQKAALEQKIQGSAQTEQVVAELRQQVETLASGNENLRLEIEKVRNEKKGEYALKLDQLTAENETLLQQIEDQKIALQKAESAKSDLAALEAEKTELLEKLKLSESLQSESAQKLEDLVQANEALQLEIDSLAFAETETLDVLAQQKRALEVSLAEQKKTFEDLEAQIASRSSQSEEIKFELSEKNDMIVDLQDQIAEKDEKIAALEAAAASELAAASNLQSYVAQLEDSSWALETELTQKQEAISSLEAALENEKLSVVALEEKLTQKMSDIEPAAAEAEQSLENQAQELADLQQKLNEALAENQRLHTEFESTQVQGENIEGELQSLKDENSALQAQVAELELMIDFSSEGEQELAILKAQLDDALAQNKILQDKVIELENAAKVAQAPDDATPQDVAASASPEVLQNLEAENAALKEQLAKYEDELKTIGDLEKSLQQAEIENTKLREELEQKSIALQALQDEKASWAEAAASGAAGVEIVSQGGSEDLDAAKARIAKLEKALAQSDQEKQRALEDLAEVYIKLKHQSPQIQPASMREVRAPSPQNAVVVADRSSEDHAAQIDPRAGGDIDMVESEVLPMPSNAPQSPTQTSIAQIDQDAPEPVYSGGTEAQMYEQQEMQAIQSQERVSSARSAGNADQNIVVRQSEDPFADIKVEDEFDGYAYSQTGGVQEQRTEQPTISDKAKSHMPREQISEPALQKQAAAPSPVKGVYHPSFTIEDVLQQADLGADVDVDLVEKASSQSMAAYEWQAGAVFGTAELSPLYSDEGFEQAVQTYLERTQSRCNGDFAIVPDDTRQVGEMRVDSYEVACVGPSVQASASLLFFNKSGTFAVLTHESDLESMDSAMNMRDRIMKTIAGAS